jgi:hypothetical protein
MGLEEVYLEARRVSQRTAHHDQLRNAAIQALQMLGWRFNEYPYYQFNVEIGMSLLSWGEHVVINIYQDGTVNVYSEGAMAFQWLDWGKNRRNILRFYNQLAAILTPPAPG